MTGKILLEDVLEEFALAVSHEGNDEKILREMTGKYPQFREHLFDYAAMLSFEKHTPEAEIPTEEMKKFEEKGLQNLQKFLDENRQTKLESVADKARELGMKKGKFAKALGVSVSLVMYLEKRRLDFSTIPKDLIKRIAETIKTTEDAVANYLKRSMTLSEQTSYKSDSRPEDLKQKSFADAVKEDTNLTSDEKEKLLNLK